jgi:hypothetical protein
LGGENLKRNIRGFLHHPLTLKYIACIVRILKNKINILNPPLSWGLSNFIIKDKYKLRKGNLLICFSSGSKNHLGKVALVDNNYN